MAYAQRGMVVGDAGALQRGEEAAGGPFPSSGSTPLGVGSNRATLGNSARRTETRGPSPLGEWSAPSKETRAVTLAAENAFSLGPSCATHLMSARLLSALSQKFLSPLYDQQQWDAHHDDWNERHLQELVLWESVRQGIDNGTQESLERYRQFSEECFTTDDPKEWLSCKSSLSIDTLPAVFCGAVTAGRSETFEQLRKYYDALRNDHVHRYLDRQFGVRDALHCAAKTKQLTQVVELVLESESGRDLLRLEHNHVAPAALQKHLTRKTWLKLAKDPTKLYYYFYAMTAAGTKKNDADGKRLLRCRLARNRSRRHSSHRHNLFSHRHSLCSQLSPGAETSPPNAQ